MDLNVDTGAILVWPYHPTLRPPDRSELPIVEHLEEEEGGSGNLRRQNMLLDDELNVT